MKSRCMPLLLCWLLPACAMLGSTPQAALKSYALAPASQSATQATPAPARATTPKRVLLVQPPTAAAGYDSNRMVYQRQPQLLEAYTQSAWIDTPARMLAPLLVQTLQDHGAFRAVVLGPSAAKAELRLDTQIVQLQQDFLKSPSTVRFSVQVTLSNNLTHEVLAWQLLESVQTAPSEDAAGGSAAASAAVQQVLGQLSRFVAANGLAPAQR